VGFFFGLSIPDPNTTGSRVKVWTWGGTDLAAGCLNLTYIFSKVLEVICHFLVMSKSVP
jgi:hypothetical protein